MRHPNLAEESLFPAEWRPAMHSPNAYWIQTAMRALGVLIMCFVALIAAAQQDAPKRPEQEQTQAEKNSLRRIDEAEARYKQLEEVYIKKYVDGDEKASKKKNKSQKERDEKRLDNAEDAWKGLKLKHDERYGHKTLRDSLKREIGELKDMVVEAHDRGPVEMSLGFKYCSGKRTLTGVEGSLIRKDLYPNETTSNRPGGYEGMEGKERSTASFGAIFSLRPWRIPIYVETGVEYEKMKPGRSTDDDESSWDFHYNDTTGLKYWVWCNYEYVRLSQRWSWSFFHFDWKTKNAGVLGGLWFNNKDNNWEESRQIDKAGTAPHLARSISANLVGGVALNINVNKAGIEYESNEPDLGPDPQIQANLNSALVGRNYTSWFWGFELRCNTPLVSIVGDLLWYRSGGDVIKTEANSYSFLEVQNDREVDQYVGIRLMFPLKHVFVGH